MPLSDERLTEIRERAEYEYPIYEDQPWDPEHAAILFLSEAATDLLNELDRLRARVAELEHELLIQELDRAAEEARSDWLYQEAMEVSDGDTE